MLAPVRKKLFGASQHTVCDDRRRGQATNRTAVDNSASVHICLQLQRIEVGDPA